MNDHQTTEYYNGNFRDLLRKLLVNTLESIDRPVVLSKVGYGY